MNSQARSWAGGQASPAKPPPQTEDRKSPPFSPGSSLSQDPYLGQLGPHLKGLDRPLGMAEAACATSIPHAGCELHCHLLNWSSWVG